MRAVTIGVCKVLPIDRYTEAENAVKRAIQRSGKGTEEERKGACDAVDFDILDTFIQRLRPETGRMVRLAEPATLQAACRIASAQEEMLGDRATELPSQVVGAASFIDTLRETIAVTVRECVAAATHTNAAARNAWTPAQQPPRQQEQQQPTWGCYQCGQVGHLKRDCPQRKCYKCGQLGHFARDCRPAVTSAATSAVTSAAATVNDQATRGAPN